jgi:hypothetical protein
LPLAGGGVIVDHEFMAYQVNAILFVGGPQAGKFDFQIDDIRLR